MSNFTEIREKTKAALGAFNVPLHPYLPLLSGKVRRSPEEVANRIVSLYLLAGLAEDADGEMMLDWLEEEGELDLLSDKDLDTLELDEIPQELMNELSWKRESLYALCWAGGVVDCMTLPDKPSDLSKVYPLIPSEVKVDPFRKSFRLRDEVEILSELDFYYNLHASLRHPELWTGGKPESKAKIGIVEERRQALEWLRSRVTDWDDISLDT